MRNDYKYYKDVFIKIGTLNVRYWDVGKGNKTLVLLHGFGGSAEEWGYTLLRLEKKFRIIVL